MSERALDKKNDQFLVLAKINTLKDLMSEANRANRVDLVSLCETKLNSLVLLVEA